MRPEPGLLWIDGSWRPSASGLDFERASLRAPHEPRGRWARAGGEDLREALAAAGRAAGEWASVARDERVGRLLEAVDALERDEALAGRLVEGLGCEEGACRELLERDLMRARESLEILRDAEGLPGGPGLFAAHWSDRVGPLVQRVALRLASGTPVVVLSDPRLPEAAEALARALEAVELPVGAAALLHDDGRTVLRAALRAAELSWGRARGSREELEALAREAGGDAFGAGLTEWALWPLAGGVRVVAEGDDPVLAAAAVVEQALSPSATLSGQLPDAVGRVLCHQRRFSAFTAELLARLDALPALAEPLVPVEEDLPEWMAEAWALGLDEGACPVFGEPPVDPRARGPRPVRPVVFTNVETGGRLLGLARPAPLVRLARVADDEQAQRLRDGLAREARPVRLESDARALS